MQRLLPVAMGGRTDADLHQAVVGFGGRRELERPLYEVLQP